MLNIAVWRGDAHAQIDAVLDEFEHRQPSPRRHRAPDEREETRFALADVPRHVEKFGFIIGVQRRALLAHQCTLGPFRP